MGGCSIDKYGEPLTDENLEIAKNSDAILLGAVGGDAATSPWYKLATEASPGGRAPENPKGAWALCKSPPGEPLSGACGCMPAEEGDREEGL